MRGNVWMTIKLILDNTSRSSSKGIATGTLHKWWGSGQPNVRFLHVLTWVDARYPTVWYSRPYMVDDIYKLHTAKADEQGLATHPRVAQPFLPASCPHGNQIARAFVGVYNCSTWNH